MFDLSNGKIGIEGSGITQACHGLHRNFTQYVTHNPAREDRAVEPESRPTLQTTIACPLKRPMGFRDYDLACVKGIE